MDTRGTQQPRKPCREVVVAEGADPRGRFSRRRSMTCLPPPTTNSSPALRQEKVGNVHSALRLKHLCPCEAAAENIANCGKNSSSKSRRNRFSLAQPEEVLTAVPGPPRHFGGTDATALDEQLQSCPHTAPNLRVEQAMLFSRMLESRLHSTDATSRRLDDRHGNRRRMRPDRELLSRCACRQSRG